VAAFAPEFLRDATCRLCLAQAHTLTLDRTYPPSRGRQYHFVRRTFGLRCSSSVWAGL